MKRLLLLAHAPSPNTVALRDALLQGVKRGAVESGQRFLLNAPDHQAEQGSALSREAQESGSEERIELVLRAPLLADPDTALDCDAYLLLTPENLGYMAGAMKDFFDRAYYPLIEATRGRPYLLVIRAGQDGTGTRRAIESIAGAGLGWKAVQAPLICQGAWQESWLDDCRDLGAGFAAGLSLGIF